MQVKIHLTDKTVTTIDKVHFYSFERNFVVVNTQDPKTRSYFKTSTVLRLEETT